MQKVFKNFDLTTFWDDTTYFKNPIKISDELVRTAEAKLGYTLPSSYIALLQTHNGGYPLNAYCPIENPSFDAEDFVIITEIYGLDEQHGMAYLAHGTPQEWGYPVQSVIIADCLSGHDAVLLDYSQCGKNGEPQVIYVDTQMEETLLVAPNFEAFIRKLVHEDRYDTTADDLQADLDTIQNGSFSSILKELIACEKSMDIAQILRTICHTLALEKAYFSLENDELSHILYALQFWLFSKHKQVTDRAFFLKVYPSILAFGDGTFCTHGYNPTLIAQWLDDRTLEKEIVEKNGVLVLTAAKEQQLMTTLKEFL